MKNKKLVALLGAVAFVVYNVIIFVVSGFSDLSATFWVSYAFMITAFITVAISMIALEKTGLKLKDWLFGYPIFRHCTAYFIVETIVSIAFMILTSFVNVPFAISLSVQILILAVYLSFLIVSFIAKNAIEDVHESVKTKRKFISLLRVEAELICEKCADPERKKIFADFAEEIKLSDPMSNESLAEIEDDIMSTVKEAGRTISEGNEEYAVLLCKKARDLLHERNKKTYALKH